MNLGVPHKFLNGVTAPSLYFYNGVTAAPPQKISSAFMEQKKRSLMV